jgi:hypothetical protein
MLMGRDGTIARGTATTAGMGSGPIEVTLRGEVYKGRWVHGNVGLGATSGFAGGTAFNAMTISSFGGSPGSALMSSDTGKTLRCQFTYGGMSGMGLCEDSQGVLYDLQIS